MAGVNQGACLIIAETMKELYLALYEKMLAEMEHCSQRYATEKEQIECCFQSCERNWNSLQLLLDTYKFSNEQEEIWFFKVIKPRFTALLEYYTLVYKATLFLPDSDSGEIHNFWQKELRFTARFFAENESFYQYYKAGQTEMDELYFVRANNDPTHIPTHKAYNISPLATTTHDHLIASFIAREKYEQYVKGKISGLPSEV